MICSFCVFQACSCCCRSVHTSLGSAVGGAQGLHLLCPALRFVTLFLVLCFWSCWEARPLEARDSGDALWFITLLACARWLCSLSCITGQRSGLLFHSWPCVLTGLVAVYFLGAGRASGLVATRIPALRQALWPCGTAFGLVLQRLVPLHAHLGVQFALACARSGLLSFVFRRLAPKLCSAAVAARPAAGWCGLAPLYRLGPQNKLLRKFFCSSRWVQPPDQLALAGSLVNGVASLQVNGRPLVCLA